VEHNSSHLIFICICDCMRKRIGVNGGHWFLACQQQLHDLLLLLRHDLPLLHTTVPYRAHEKRGKDPLPWSLSVSWLKGTLPSSAINHQKGRKKPTPPVALCSTAEAHWYFPVLSIPGFKACAIRHLVRTLYPRGLLAHHSQGGEDQ